MDMTPKPFVPPIHPLPDRPMGKLEFIRAVYDNPLRIWGERAFNEPHIVNRMFGITTIVVNDPKVIRRVLVDNAANYRLAPLRQRILRPMLRDGLLTAEGDTWKRTRKAVAHVFTPRHVAGFARVMQKEIQGVSGSFTDGEIRPIGRDMTTLTYNVLVGTLFSDEVSGDRNRFEERVNTLLDTMGRLDPFDLLGMPDWIPRVTRLRGAGTMGYFRQMVRETVEIRKAKRRDPAYAKREDFLDLLLDLEGPDGISQSEIEDNVITFIGAGHETTARALAWTLYLLARSPHERAKVEAEIDAVTARLDDPNDWLANMPVTRAAFDETLRLFPPAVTINRNAIGPDRLGDLDVSAGDDVVVLLWSLHRHRALWKQPDAFMPDRFLPENRDSIDRYQFLPFGAGARVCIGQVFAQTEAVIALATLMRDWRFDMASAANPLPVQKLTLQPDGGVTMKVTRRR